MYLCGQTLVVFLFHSKMALCHYPCPEEIDVFTGPHLRMKQLVYEALEEVGVFIIHEVFLFRNLAVL